MLPRPLIQQFQERGLDLADVLMVLEEDELIRAQVIKALRRTG